MIKADKKDFVKVKGEMKILNKQISNMLIPSLF